ncbi:gene transfer agent family protein [Rhodobacteraceae bacterium XHP0102]|nr:gene transfer agent family protein [Rhodobacteraceae bacterium XHP0102]
MVNEVRGEVALTIDGQRHVARLTLHGLAELEAALGTESLADLIARFEGAQLRAQDILLLLVAGLRGGGWQGEVDDLAQAEIEGGVAEATRVAARLLILAFQGPAP